MSTLQHACSGSDTDARYAMMDEKKRKRMISNRESARRSRLKRQKRMEDMINEISTLQRKIQESNQKCNLVMQRIAMIESENVFLSSERMRLANYMNSLEMIMMRNLKQDDDQTAKILTDCRKPWQVGVCVGGDGGPMQPIMSSGMFKL